MSLLCEFSSRKELKIQQLAVVSGLNRSVFKGLEHWLLLKGFCNGIECNSISTESETHSVCELVSDSMRKTQTAAERLTTISVFACNSLGRMSL